ncbi:hypothetical protein ACTFIR_003648 [Dictyostelium discoideum]
MSNNKNNLTIILVHGAWGNSLHWNEVSKSLLRDGYKVVAVENPLTSLQDDITKTRDLIDAQDGKVLLVGHSYGGSVITGAGNHDKVVGLVYIAAFAPDEGDSIFGIFSRREQPSGGANILPADKKGFLWINYDKFPESFCQDLSKDDAMVLSISQKPIHSNGFSDKLNCKPAWRTKPSWYQVSNNDNMIPPETELEMAKHINAKKIIQINASHASLASHPKEVFSLIKEAANSLNSKLPST